MSMTKREINLISVIIPAYNEENAIAGVIESIKTILRQNNLEESEIIVVNDGSVDNTCEQALQTGVRVVTNPHNIGYGKSLKRGIAAASHDTIVIVDADGTYSFDHLPLLLKEYHKGFNMVVGQRTGEVFKGGLIKYILRFILRFLVEYTVGRKIPDPNSGFRIFSKKEAMTQFAQLSDKFSFTTSITMSYMLSGRFVHYVKIPYHERIGVTKVKLMIDMLRTLQYIVQNMVYYNPLKTYVLLAFLPLSVGVFSLLCVYYLGIQLALFLFFLSGLLGIVIFAIGLLATTIGLTRKSMEDNFEINDKL